jgi:hypothetical protein
MQQSGHQCALGKGKTLPAFNYRYNAELTVITTSMGRKSDAHRSRMLDKPPVHIADHRAAFYRSTCQEACGEKQRPKMRISKSENKEKR